MAVSYKKLWKLLIDRNMNKEGEGFVNSSKYQYNDSCPAW